MKRSISRQLLEPHFSSSSLAEETCICVICQAVYAPSRLHAYLLQAPPIARESAFISMCHFCFRCHRPSCPNCWDTIHSVCAQCAYETHLPFRSETPPQEGLFPLSPPRDLSVDEDSVSSSLVSEHHGRFQQSLSSPSIDTIGTRPDPPSSPARFPLQSSGTFIVSSPSSIERIKTRPERSRSLSIERIKTRPERSKSLYIERIKTHPERSRSSNISQHVSHTSPSTTRKQKLARILLTISLLLIFLLAGMTASALLSVDANLFMKNALDIDIRGVFSSLGRFLNSLF